MAPRGKQSSIEDRKIIIEYFKSGKTIREIAKIVQKSHSTVYDIVKRYRDENRITNKCRKGQRKILSATDEWHILCEINRNPFISAPKLAEEVKLSLKKDVNPETIRRVLRANNFRGRDARKKPLSEKNRKMRLKFGKQVKTKDCFYWKKFQDESNITTRIETTSNFKQPNKVTRENFLSETEEPKQLHNNNAWSSSERNEYDVYAEGLSSKLRKISNERLRLIVQRDIDNLLYDALLGMGKYENVQKITVRQFSNSTSCQSPEIESYSVTAWEPEAAMNDVEICNENHIILKNESSK